MLKTVSEPPRQGRTGRRSLSGWAAVVSIRRVEGSLSAFGTTVLWALNPSESLLKEVRRDCSPKLFTTKGIFPITLVSSDSAFTGTEPDCGYRITRSYSHCRHRCAVFRTRSVCRLWRPRSMLHNSPFSRSGRRTAPESLRRDLPGDAVGAGSGSRLARPSWRDGIRVMDGL
jgi:hypothetical protein